MLDQIAQAIADNYQMAVKVEQTHAEPNGRYFITVDPQVLCEEPAQLNGMTLDQAMWALEGIAAGAEAMWAKWRDTI